MVHLSTHISCILLILGCILLGVMCPVYADDGSTYIAINAQGDLDFGSISGKYVFGGIDYFAMLLAMNQTMQEQKKIIINMNETRQLQGQINQQQSQILGDLNQTLQEQKNINEGQAQIIAGQSQIIANMNETLQQQQQTIQQQAQLISALNDRLSNFILTGSDLLLSTTSSSTTTTTSTTTSSSSTTTTTSTTTSSTLTTTTSSSRTTTTTISTTTTTTTTATTTTTTSTVKPFLPSSFSRPCAVTVSPKNNMVFVADTYNYRIQIFYPNGSYMSMFSSPASQGLAITSNNEIIVSDDTLMSLYSLNGTLLKVLTNQIAHPRQLAIYGNDSTIYVADNFPQGIHTGCINNIAMNGTLLKKWCSYTKNNAVVYIDGTVTLAISPFDGNIYVADLLSCNIQVYQPDGSFIRNWGSCGNSNGLFSTSIQGIAISTITGNVFVSDTGNNRIQVFRSDGSFVRSWGSFGTAYGQFNDNIGIAISPDGARIYVCDYWNNRVQVFPI